MFNDIEWLCFLINEKFISYKKILKQLEPTLIHYYENWFLKYVSKGEKDSSAILNSLNYIRQSNKSNHSKNQTWEQSL